MIRTAVAAVCLMLPVRGLSAGELPIHPLVEAYEQQRIEAIEKITPATIAVFDSEGNGGGSGVIVRADGLAVTNFHVVAPCGPFMLCGLPDGSMTKAVMLGVDPPGDVAVIRLLDDREYPAAEVGDSDQARAGQEVIIAGNPFLLADDLRPTINVGILSGVRRYQYPAGTILEYADCLQTDAAINPGNSGGPLYSAAGALIGINGRGSFEKRGRVNVGVGYAISINQVMRFLPFLESGRIVDHSHLGATVATLGQGKAVVDKVLPESDAYRRGLRFGDRIVSIADRTITSANQVQNVVATYPPGWRLPVTVRREGVDHTLLVRLQARHSQGKLEEIVAQQLTQLEGDPPVKDRYEARPGFTNYAANREMRNRVLKRCPQRVEAAASAVWRLNGLDAQGGASTIELKQDRATFASSQGEYWITPTKPLAQQRDPPGSGGLLAALHIWSELLTTGADGLQQVYYQGKLPWGSNRALCDCVVVNQGSVRAEFYFECEGSNLVGIEYFADDSTDSCSIAFDDYPQGATAPNKIIVFTGDAPWLELMQVRLTIEALNP